MKSSRLPLVAMLICLTCLSIIAQLIFFSIHASVSTLVDSLVSSSLFEALFYPSVYLPLIQFLILQIAAYILLLWFILFVVSTFRKIFDWQSDTAYWFGILLWVMTTLAILGLNSTYYPYSFFAGWVDYAGGAKTATIITIVASIYVLLAISMAVGYRLISSCKWRYALFILVAVLVYGKYSQPHVIISDKIGTPNVIIIGLDSLRPDFTGANKYHVNTPHINQFMQSALVFSEAYTPLARTYPSWVSILTGKYPRHHGARFNLAEPAQIMQNQTLSRRLQQSGYVTFYATDEARFADINEQYGFDIVVRPKRGLVDFILGGLTDFPLTNLLVNMPGGRFLFPYHYTNRAAYITYHPENFLKEVEQQLQARTSGKPLFLAIHLCSAHWPFLFSDQTTRENYLPSQYKSSVEAVDKQLGELLEMLGRNQLLKNSLVVLLSDHGTALGLPDDRSIKEANYLGDREKLKYVTVSRLSSAPENSVSLKDYTVNTSYGQGNDVMSLVQHHILLAMKGYGVRFPVKKSSARVSLIDIAPTILGYLQLAPLKKIDGLSLYPSPGWGVSRPLYFETGDKIAGIEPDRINVPNVVRQAIDAYRVNRDDGALTITTAAGNSIIANKQYGVLTGHHLRGYYPKSAKETLVLNKKTGYMAVTSVSVPAYFIDLDLKTGAWDIR